MKALTIGLQVKYVAAPDKEGGSVTTKDGVIIGVVNATTARIDITPRKRDANNKWVAADPDKAPLESHVAEARYSTDRDEKNAYLENTFHFAEDETATQPDAAATAKPPTKQPAAV